MGERTANVRDADLGATLSELAAVIRARREASTETSYTARLLAAPEDTLYKKLVEEATELVLASKDADHDHIRYEAADLVYHLLVLLERTGISPEELAGELKARMLPQ
jgi:phosphoribosyl-ATP pyrophosphohydrolase